MNQQEKIKDCDHAAKAGSMQLYKDKVIAECADCPAEHIEATKLYQQQAEKGKVMVENWKVVK